MGEKENGGDEEGDIEGGFNTECRRIKMEGKKKTEKGKKKGM